MYISIAILLFFQIWLLENKILKHIKSSAPKKGVHLKKFHIPKLLSKIYNLWFTCLFFVNFKYKCILLRVKHMTCTINISIF